MDVAIVSSPGQGVYARFVQALLVSPELTSARFEQFEPRSLKEDSLAHQDVVLAVGVQSAQAALKLTSKPVLAVMLSEASYQELLLSFPHARLAAVVLDQPIARQIALFKALWPGKSVLGVLLGRHGSALHMAMQREAEKKGLSLKFGFLHGTQGSVPVLEALMDGSDAILAPADPDAFNAQNARVILLTTYRAGVPVLSFSASAVEAGALAAVFSTPENIAQQVAGWLAQQKSTGISLPSERAPKYFDVLFNRQVARSLKQDIPDTEVVLQRIRAVCP
ncbi:MAG TPA: hypothetical protein ENO09_00170 [bacterium]|nr:hypothetical protein [bacterium]